jgi:hypothetical protein
MGFELTTPAFDQAKTVHALERVATVIGTDEQLPLKFHRELQTRKHHHCPKGHHLTKDTTTAYYLINNNSNGSRHDEVRSTAAAYFGSTGLKNHGLETAFSVQFFMLFFSPTERLDSGGFLQQKYHISSSSYHSKLHRIVSTSETT